MMDDVLIVGAGPAGSVAALALARAGARVRLIDRACFPRDKLCGDTVNPGSLAMLRRLGLAGRVEAAGLPVEGMRLTGEDGTCVDGRYPDGLTGRAIVRRDLDGMLLDAATAAGAALESPLTVRAAIVDETASREVRGVVVACGGDRQREIRARVTIAADGRRSTLAFGLGAARHPARPRRWAVGGYFENVSDLRALGEMHVRSGRYIGIAAVPGGLANVCLVKPSQPGDPAFGDPAGLLMREVARDRLLADRFASARLVQGPVVLGPLAVDARPFGVDGLLLAGDAAGFVDPMTGDGLRFAIRGGELAADAALDALEHGWRGVHARLTARRRQEFGAKWRFNRALRALVSSPRAIRAAAFGARLAPSGFRAIITRAGDCGLC